MVDRADFVLASGSPRRRELLAQQGYRFLIEPPDVDETPRPGETPDALVERLATTKAAAVHTSLPTLAADTVVSIDGSILGKPRDENDAVVMLSDLSGRSHRVSSGVAVHTDAVVSFVVVTTVHFVELSTEAIERYVATGEPLDKAGAYGIQGVGGAFVEAIEGSYTNVVGLPLAETVRALREVGITAG